MSTVTPPGATIPGVKHHLAGVNATKLHYVSAGDSGSPILLVHGWPETWWAFRKLIPLLAQTHRVFALDLRGFGDSSSADAEYGEAVAAEDLHRRPLPPVLGDQWRQRGDQHRVGRQTPHAAPDRERDDRAGRRGQQRGGDEQ